MDVNTVFSLINSVGFPIVACAYLAYDRYKSQQKMVEAVENNTKTMQEIIALFKTEGSL